MPSGLPVERMTGGIGSGSTKRVSFTLLRTWGGEAIAWPSKGTPLLSVTPAAV
ncbi:hypothetical protein [Granulicella sp. L60]|uniref:hypothetical protein n=1 Tax=Granulicella sp. L60 TaxID=1641866 RepID=UPI0020B115F2|nr:hypothetical protein [Granulicella sp. L60]